MTRLKLYYEGWLMLPASFRQALDLETNAVLEAELVDGAVVLRPTGEGRAAVSDELKAAEPSIMAALPVSSATADAPARRGPDRPRKVQLPEQLETAALPRPRGRPRRVMTEPADAAASPASIAVPSELRRKAVVQVPTRDQIAPPHEQALESARPAQEERRPFKHVEVRKLGPGRRHTKLHGLA